MDNYKKLNLEPIKTILFICSGNTCRSPAMEAIFNSKNSGIKAMSRGLNVEKLRKILTDKVRLPPEIIKKELSLAEEMHNSLDKLGIKHENGRDAKQISEEDLKKAQLILTADRETKKLLGELIKLKGDDYKKIFTLKEFLKIKKNYPVKQSANIDTLNPFRHPIDFLIEFSEKIKNVKTLKEIKEAMDIDKKFHDVKDDKIAESIKELKKDPRALAAYKKTNVYLSFLKRKQEVYNVVSKDIKNDINDLINVLKNI